MPQLFNVQVNTQDVPKIQLEHSGRTTTAAAHAESEQSFHSILKQALPENSGQKQNGTRSNDPNPPLSEENLDINASALEETTGFEGFQNLFKSPNSTIANQPFPGRQTIAGTSPELTVFLSQKSGVVLSENLVEQLRLLENVSGQQQKTSAFPVADATNPQALSQDKQPGLVAATTPLNDTKGLLAMTGQQQSQVTFSDLPVQQSVQASPVATSPQQEALLKQLQSMIDSGAEAGILSIKNMKGADALSPLRPQQLNLATLQKTETSGPEIITATPLTKGEGATTLQEAVFAPTLRSRQQQLEGVRHDKTQQFYDAKTQPQNLLTDASNSAGKQQGNEMNSQGSGFSQVTPFSQNPESGSTFSLPVSQGADPLATQLTETGKTSMLPSGTVVQDQEVMQQIVERFRVNKRLLESKIQLKLHPVELGKLEIDLTVKEGSIRANVIAQSQHVQDILEKNIARLKSVLEQQGFSVEEILITTESDAVDNFDMFDQQLSDSESSNFQDKNDNTETHTPFVLDEFQESSVENPSGVNVKA